MQPTGGTNHSSGALPPRQTWHPVHRRLLISICAAAALLPLVSITLRWSAADERGLWDLTTLLSVGQTVAFTILTWIHTRTRIDADTEGLHLVDAFRTVTYPWEDIAEIRPSIAKGKRTYLVLVRRNHPIIDLPITEEHLDELRRWHQAATT
ncbi:PH domain-containing protein [Georgenia daeguensis]|uniref:PH domain-containing protein n=1 Tax=Georgenia daeguensis TaxID=908355 RepID=UPI0031E60691